LKIVQIKKTLKQSWQLLLSYHNYHHESGFAPRILTKLLPIIIGIENSSNKKTLKQAWQLLLSYHNYHHESGFAPRILTKLRFENSSNKKTLKQAWRFFI